MNLYELKSIGFPAKIYGERDLFLPFNLHQEPSLDSCLEYVFVLEFRSAPSGYRALHFEITTRFVSPLKNLH